MMIVDEDATIMGIFSSSGGVIIYFDRVEVVNLLSLDAGMLYCLKIVMQHMYSIHYL